MHSEAARQKRFQPRACRYIFDLIVVASISSVQPPCACVFTSQVQGRTTCMDLDCVVERTSIFKGPCGYPRWPSSGSQARKRTYATVVGLVMLFCACAEADVDLNGLLHMYVYGCGLAGCVSQVGGTCEHMLVCVLVVQLKCHVDANVVVDIDVRVSFDADVNVHVHPM